MRLESEMYRGKTISFVQKIMGGKPMVVGRWWFEGKIKQIIGPSKLDVLTKIKRIIAAY